VKNGGFKQLKWGILEKKGKKGVVSGSQVKDLTKMEDVTNEL
jgi:hypothetical protein